MIKWKYKPSGNCPVQAEGYFSGYYFYFRARGEHATIEFSKEQDSPEVAYYILARTQPYMAGWIPKWICRLLIWKGCIKFLFKNKTK
jgi:hypothetical protein